MIGMVGRKMKRKGAIGLSIAAFLAAPVQVPAADCKQENAVYADRDGAYELRFTPLNSPSAAANNQFKINALNASVTMDGYVMPSEDPERAVGIVMFKCPEGDATGTELDACTVWQGMVYGMNTGGEVDNLKPEGAVAADKIFLPGIGPAIRAFEGWGGGKTMAAPWDVLNFKECAA